MSDIEKRDPEDDFQGAEELADESIAAGDKGDNGGEGDEAVEEQPKLNLDVKIDARSACERHITVAVAREDIDRYFDKEYSELMPTAQVPGFRPGHAPRKLIEHRFHKDVAQRVKSALLMDSLTQIHEEQDLSAISEPDLDLDAVEVPEQGPLCFEFDLEVRPEFALPKWKGLKIQKPSREFTAEDIDQALERLLANRGRLVPHDGPAAPGDYISTNLRFEHEGHVLASARRRSFASGPRSASATARSRDSKS